MVLLLKEAIELCDLAIEERLILCKADIDKASDEFVIRQITSAAKLSASSPIVLSLSLRRFNPRPSRDANNSTAKRDEAWVNAALQRYPKWA